MNVGLGVAAIVAGSLLALLISLGAWHRLARAIAFGLLAACGLLVGAGALLVQDRASGVEWAITLVALGVTAPVHARVVFGVPGARR